MFRFFREKLAFLKLRRSFAPRPGFRSELWRRLEAEIVPAPAVKRAYGRLAWVGVSVLVMAVVSGSTGAYAYTSSSVTPDNPLYQVKRGIERIQEQVAITPEAKAGAKAMRLAHRLAEARKMTQSGVRIGKVMQEIDREFESDQSEGPSVPRAVKLAERADDDAVEALGKIAASDPAVAMPAVRRVIQKDVRRIETRISEAKDEQARQFLNNRLASRRAALLRMGGADE